MARKKVSKRGDPSPFAQDLTGILLVAFSIFVLVSNFSSLTGLIGLYIVKLAFRAILGVGIYILPFFSGAYGLILLFRHEVKELKNRLFGLLILFLTFITAVQFYSPNYFKADAHYPIIQGAGGFVGYVLRFSLERTIGFIGAYIILVAFALISSLFIFNLTVLDFVSWVKSFFSFTFTPRTAALKTRKPITIQKPMIEDDFEEEEEKKPTQIQMPLLDNPLQPSMHIHEIDADSEEPIVPKVQKIVEFKTERMELQAEEGDSKDKEKEKPSYSKYKFPPLSLLDDPSSRDVEKQDKLKETTEFRKKLLEDTLFNFGVGARVVSTNQGPAVTRYELQPDPGVKISRIASLADDIALNLAAQGVRIEAPVPGRSVVGIEVPNTTVTAVRLKEIVKTPEFQNNPSKLFVALGKDLAGQPIYGDLAKMPHLLIAGTTGSGKSVCMNSIIISLLLRARPDEVKFIMIDPKMVELSVYDDIPHLLAPVVTDPMRAALTLKEWVMREMERRYKLFYDIAARNLHSYNSKVEQDKKLPQIVVFIDELADLMMLAAADVESTICRLAQMARATGIHLVIATQRPSVDVITGLIKANVPSRIAFAVATQIDSRVILDSSGAEKLLGRGDMLYNPIGAMKPTRAQGSFVTDKETEKIIDFIKEQAAPEYLDEIISLKVPEGEISTKEGTETGGKDLLFNDAVKLIIESQVASTSYLQRKMRIGYNRAARLMDEIEAAGIVSRAEGDQKARRITASMETLMALGIR